MFVSVWPFDKKRRGRKVILGSLTSIQRHRRRIASDMVQICHSPKHSCCWLLPRAVIHHFPPRNVILKASFWMWILVQKPSKHNDKVILKVFTCCFQTIYYSQFKVFVLVDACFHWEPLTEPLQPLHQLQSPGPTAEHCASQRLAPAAPTHCFSEATRGTTWHCRSHSQAGARDTPFTHVHTYPHPSIYVHTPFWRYTAVTP